MRITSIDKSDSARFASLVAAYTEFLHWYVHRHPSERFAGAATAQSRGLSNVNSFVPPLDVENEEKWVAMQGALEVTSHGLEVQRSWRDGTLANLFPATTIWGLISELVVHQSNLS